MDDDDKFIGTILSRRDALRAAAVAGASLVLGRVQANAPALSSVHLVVTPGVEEGPFFVEEGLNRRDVTTQTDRKSVTEGSPLIFGLTIYSLKDREFKALKGAHVDIWHADASGSYSDEASNPIQPEDTKGQKWLRGYQVSGADGKIEFRTIYPGWYQSRTPHIHVKVRIPDVSGSKTFVFNTQLFFDEETNDHMLNRAPYNLRGNRRVRNLWDGLYSMKQADGTMTGSHLHCDVKRGKDGVVKAAHFSLALKLD